MIDSLCPVCRGWYVGMVGHKCPGSELQQAKAALTAERERSARLEAELANLRAQPGGAVPPFWWTRGHRTHPPRPFATKMHDAHWLVRHEDGTLDTFAYETPDLYVAEGESVVEYRRVAATKADAREDE